jgi:threonylcarbamoyladenosine tRNA methylthiotransferase MtaB
MPEIKKPKVYYIGFGCRLNQFETRVLKNSPDSDLLTTQNQNEADFIVINTCTVTNRADVKNRQAIRKARQSNPNARIIVTGCYATTDPDSLNEMKEVDTVISNANKFTIPDFIAGGKIHQNTNPFPVSNQTLKQSARAYIKIQDGCNKLCSYCKIPMSRGKAVSRGVDDTLTETQNLVRSGFNEIILTGVNLGQYKTNQNRINDLLMQLQDIPGNHYYRISSIEPDCINDEFLDIVASEKFAKFLHIPLQSGSNQILKAMRRGYTAEKYADIIGQIKNKIPGIHIGTDVIAGFPGETDADFELTFELVKKLEFSNVHVFPFSKRSGSEIDAILLNQKSLERKIEQKISSFSVFEVHGEVVRNRISRLLALHEQNKVSYVQKTSGMPFRAIVETITADNSNTAHFVTENYLKGGVTSEVTSTIQLQKGQQICVTYDPFLKFTLYKV